VQKLGDARVFLFHLLGATSTSLSTRLALHTHTHTHTARLGFFLQKRAI